jgi:uncharacterized protein (TIGR02246 family)
VRSTLIVVALAAIVLPAGATAQTTFRIDPRGMSAADAELAALRIEYAAAATAGDAQRLSALYAHDAIAVPREGLLLRGPAQIQQYSVEAFSAVPGGATVTLTPRQFEARGSMASETGTFAETRAGESEPSATGVYVAIYTRGSDGVWRIAMEVRTRGRDQQAVRW